MKNLKLTATCQYIFKTIRDVQLKSNEGKSNLNIYLDITYLTYLLLNW